MGKHETDYISVSFVREGPFKPFLTLIFQPTPAQLGKPPANNGLPSRNYLISCFLWVYSPKKSPFSRSRGRFAGMSSATTFPIAIT
jgi:hypothetical protein